MSSYEIWKRVEDFVNYSAEDSVGDELLDYCEILLNGIPTFAKRKNTEERRCIESGSVSLYPGLQLNTAQIEGILKLSDELNASEFECLRCWVKVSDPSTRRWLEVQTNAALGFYDYRIFLASREYLVYEMDTILNAVISLMKSRIDTNLSEQKRSTIMCLTNKLLREGLATRIISSISRHFEELQSCHSSNKFYFNFMLHQAKKLSECLFFIFYQTQILAEEEKSLSELIRSLCSLICREKGGHDLSYVNTELNVDHELCPTLITLQLTQVCGLAQTHDLYDRDLDTPPYLTPDSQNRLTPPLSASHSMDALLRHLGVEKRNFPSSPFVKGFMYLPYAVLVQAAVDSDNLPSSFCTNLLTEASVARAYSYIRLGMLPVLRASCDNDTLPFYMSVLSELIGNLITLFCLDIYPRFPFPSSRAQHSEDIHWSSTQLVMPMTTPSTSSTSSTSLHCDCLDDVLLLILEMSQFYPAFSKDWFWRNGSYHPFVAKALDVSRDPIIATKFLCALSTSPDAATAYPTYLFIEKKLAGRRDWSFMFRYIQDIATQLGPQLQDHLIDGGGSGMMFGSTENILPPNMDYSAAAAAGGGRGMSMTAPKKLKLSPKDTDALLAMLQLFEISFQQPQVVQSLQCFFRYPDSILNQLFALLGSAVPSILKGAVFRSLASYIGSCPEACDEVWRLMEEYRLLPMTATTTTTTATGIQGSGGMPTKAGSSNANPGLRYELEVVESGAGTYPATNGFLILLDALLRHGIPEALGTGYRRPGVLGYLEYVVQEVLLKLPQRPWSPEGVQGEGQIWRLAARSLRILVTVLQAYGVNAISVAAAVSGSSEKVRRARGKTVTDYSSDNIPALKMWEADFQECNQQYAMSTDKGKEIMQTWPRPKTAGFAVMTWLLARTRLLDCLFQLLRDCVGDSLEKSRVEQVDLASISMGNLLRQHPFTTPTTTTTKKFTPNISGYPNSLVATSHASSGTMDLSALGVSGETSPDGCNSDATYWRERTVGLCLGILHECCLREEHFVRLVWSAEQPLTLLGSESNRPLVIPVRVQRLSTVLSSHPAGSPLAVIAKFIREQSQQRTFSNLCTPPLSVLATRILQHVSECGEDLGLLSSEDEAELLSSAIRAITLDSDTNSSVELGNSNSSTGMMLIPLGGDMLTSSSIKMDTKIKLGIDVFSFPYSGGLTLSSEMVSDYQFHNDMNSEIGVVGTGGDKERERSYGDSARETFIDLITTSLLRSGSSGDGVAVTCLGLRLLGLRELMEQSRGSGSGNESSIDSLLANTWLASPNLLQPSNCLEGLLSVLLGNDLTVVGSGTERVHPLREGLPTSLSSQLPLIMISPLQASKGYELLYYLCSSPLTSTAILTLLRSPSVNFLSQLLPYCFQLQVDDISSSSSLSLDSKELNERCLNLCRAWILKILSLDLRAISSMGGTYYLSTYVRKLMQFLYGDYFGIERNDDHDIDGDQEDGQLAMVVHTREQRDSSDIIPLLEITHFLSLSDSDSLLPQVNNLSPEVAHIMTSCCRRCDHAGTGGMGFTVVDLSLFRAELLYYQQEQQQQRQRQPQPTGSPSDLDVEQCLQAAVLYNKYSLRSVVSTQLATAFSHVVGISTLDFSSYLLPSNSKARTSSIRTTLGSQVLGIDNNILPENSLGDMGWFMDSMVLPLSHAIASQREDGNNDSWITEPLARALLSCLSLITRSGRIPSHSSIIVLVRHILGTLTLRRGSAGSDSSQVFRGLTTSSLLHCLKLLTPLPSTMVGERNSSIISDYHEENERDGTKMMEVLQVFIRAVPPLIEILSKDALHGVLIWRLTSLSAFTAILTFARSISSSLLYNQQEKRSPPQNKLLIELSTTVTENMVYQLSNHGFLHALFMSVPQRRQYPGGRREPFQEGFSSVVVSSTLLLPLDANDEWFSGIFGLLAVIAQTGSGAKLLLDQGLLTVLKQLPVELFPVPVLGRASNSTSNSQLDLTTSALCLRLTPLLHLMVSLTYHCQPTSITVSANDVSGMSSIKWMVLDSCVHLLRKLQDCFRALLKLRHPTLLGLKLIEDILTIMVLVAASPSPSPTSLGNREGGGAATTTTLSHPPLVAIKTSFWDSELDLRTKELYSKDICWLLETLGRNPIPIGITGTTTATTYQSRTNWSIDGNNYLNKEQQQQQGDDYRQEWWREILPTNEIEITMSMTPVSVSVSGHKDRDRSLTTGTTGRGGFDTSSLFHPWSQFDEEKLSSSLRVLNVIGSFLRFRLAMYSQHCSTLSTSPTSHSIQGSMLSFSSYAVDMTTVTEALIACCEAYSSLDDHDSQPSSHDDTTGAGRGTGPGTADDHWLESNSEKSKEILRMSDDSIDGNTTTGLRTSSPRLLLIDICEKLACALYDYCLSDGSTTTTMSLEEDWERMAPLLKQCIDTTSQSFPSHSLTRVVMRWIRERLETVESTTGRTERGGRGMRGGR